MDNTGSLNLVASAISDAETEIKELDKRLAAVKAKETEIAELEAAHQNNTADFSGDFKARLKTHSANSSALVLHRADLVSLNAAVDSQKKKCLAAGKAAATKMSIVRDLLLLKRRENVEAWIGEQFEYKRIHIYPRTLAETHVSYLAVKNLAASNHFFQAGADPDWQIMRLRELGARFAELRPLAETEEGLDLSMIVAEPAAAPPIAEPEPAGAGNRLGTLTEPVMA